MHKLTFASLLTLGLALLPSTVFAAPPTVITLPPTGISESGVTLNGNVTADGGSGITGRGFVYSVNSVDPTPTIGEANVTQVQNSSGTTGFYQNFLFSGLAGSTTYAVAAYAINADGTSYGAVLTFTTKAPRETLISNQPAATLLLPYFEVDLDNPQGVTTLFSINSATDDAVLTNVVIWSDLGVPVFNFNVYLTGYDVQAINLRDILVTGLLPRTASFGQDPADTISPKGPISSDGTFASCSDVLPYDPLDAAMLAHVQASLTGQASPLSGQCSAVNYNSTPRLARGYVTIDVVSSCGLIPGDPGYFINGGLGTATNDNVLWGDYFYANPSVNRAEGDPLVHITASETDSELNTPGQYTFYGRQIFFTAADNREPLATSFAVRYINYDFKEPKKNRVRERTRDLGTDLVVWRDSKVKQNQFACAGLPSWYPLGQEGIVIFDETEEPQSTQPPQVAPLPPFLDILPFKAATQRVRVNTPTLPTMFSSGWMYLNLNTVVVSSFNPPEDPAAAQAWVTTLLDVRRSGRYAVGFRGIRLDSAKTATHVIPGGF